MNIFYFLSGIVFLLIFVICLIRFLKMDKGSPSYRVMKLVFFVSIFSLIVSVLFFMWNFNLIRYSFYDFALVFGGFCVGFSLVFFRVVFLFSGNKRLNYFLVLYIGALVFGFFSGGNYLFLILSSSLFLFLVFYDFVFRIDVYKNIGYLGVGFALVLTVIFFFGYYGVGDNLFGFFILFAGFILFCLIFIFVRDIEKYSILPEKYDFNRGYFFVLFGHLMFVLIVVNFVFIGTVAAHEAGHYGVFSFLNCVDKKIVYDNSMFHVEGFCTGEMDNIYSAWGGILFPFLVALVFGFFNIAFFREVAILMTGFNFFAISKDLIEIGYGRGWLIFSEAFGVICVLLGVFLLSKSRIDSKIYGGYEIDKER